MTPDEIDALLQKLYTKPKGERETVAVLGAGKRWIVTCDDPVMARKFLKRGHVPRRTGESLEFDLPAKALSIRALKESAAEVDEPDADDDPLS